MEILHSKDYWKRAGCVEVERRLSLIQSYLAKGYLCLIQVGRGEWLVCHEDRICKVEEVLERGMRCGQPLSDALADNEEFNATCTIQHGTNHSHCARIVRAAVASSRQKVGTSVKASAFDNN